MPRTSTVHAVTAIGIDMGKSTLHMIGLDARGAIVLREKVSRGRIALRFANMPPCLIGIEAGLATHYVARELAALGHDVKQVPPAYAKPFRQMHKNDFRDAHAVAEAVQRPTTRFVPAKTDEQLDLQALHRMRSRLVSERTAVINQIRGFLLERGIIVRQGLRFLRQALPDILAKRTDVLSPRIVCIIADLATDWRQLDERIEAVTDEIETLAKSDDSCRRVMTVPGIGPIRKTGRKREDMKTEEAMNIDRRHLVLPALVVGLIGTVPTLGATSEEDAVAKNVEAFRVAQIAADVQAFDVLCAPELSYSHSDGHVEDKATFIANATNGKSKFLMLEYLQPQIRVVGTAAIVRFHWVAESQSVADGTKSKTNLHILMNWQKQGTEWKLLSRASTKL